MDATDDSNVAHPHYVSCYRPGVEVWVWNSSPPQSSTRKDRRLTALTTPQALQRPSSDLHRNRTDKVFEELQPNWEECCGNPSSMQTFCRT